MANRLALVVFALLTSGALACVALSLPRAPLADQGPGPSLPTIVAELPRLPAAPPPPPAVQVSEPRDEAPARTLADQRRALFRAMAEDLDLSNGQLLAVARLFGASPILGQGNPALSRHGMTRAECRSIREEAGLHDSPHAPAPCDRKNMVPLYDPEAGQTAKDAPVCIDQFEFPDIACEYPVVHASAREAALLCEATGKRLCDAHEWEGACAGALHDPEVEYSFDKGRPYATWLHNKNREIRWAYGPQKNHALCATGTPKTPGCPGGGYVQCGSNTYPAGSFPACVSPFGVYDQHGNAAEHMNLPLSASELASAGGSGATEMKGSWFVFQREEAHEDDCRWRAKDWHPSRVMAEDSHRNYHLGFRCCQDVGDEVARPAAP